MFYLIQHVGTLLIDADDFGSAPQLLQQIMEIISPHLSVQLISRHHDTPHRYPTIVPKTIQEHCNFQLQIENAMEHSVPNSVVYLCGSIDALEQLRQSNAEKFSSPHADFPTLKSTFSTWKHQTSLSILLMLYSDVYYLKIAGSTPSAPSLVLT